MAGAATRVLLVALLFCITAACGSTFDFLMGEEERPSEQSDQAEAPRDAPTGQAEQPDQAEEPEFLDPGEPAELVRVVDGDSVELAVDGSSLDFRLAAYNAPELYRSSTVAESSGGEDGDRLSCNGEAAKAALADLLGQGPLAVLGEEIDRFGRRLADVRLSDGSLVSVEMIDRGWGLAVGDDDGARELMKLAATDRRGMWGDQCGQPQSTELVIGETQPDPPGSDRDNLNDEWVQILNRSDTPIDLAGWTVRDDTTGHRFPLTGTLGANATLTVRSGAGRSTESDFFLGETFPVWSNQNETVLLVDPQGVVANWAFVD